MREVSVSEDRSCQVLALQSKLMLLGWTELKQGQCIDHRGLEPG